MAEERVHDAQTLMDGGRWTFAYYTIGYAAECGLKASILTRMIHTGGVFEDKKFAEKCWTHDLDALIELAGLTVEFGIDRGANSILDGFWKIATKWTETSRYQQKTQVEAEELYQAITDEPDGVLQWLRKHW